jgi:hypothetical protein
MTIALHEEKVRLESKVKTKIEPDRLRARLKSKENNDKKF